MCLSPDSEARMGFQVPAAAGARLGSRGRVTDIRLAMMGVKSDYLLRALDLQHRVTKR